MGGSTVKVPGPSPEERELQKNQAELLSLQRQIIEQQRSQQAVLLPFLAEQEGFDVTTDEFGNITSISRTPTELEKLREELEFGLTERSLAALRGELPVSPGLERELSDQERVLRERLSQQLGPGFETSTAGIETLGEFFQSSEILREGARRGELSLAEQLGIAREQQNQFNKRTSQDFLRQIAVGDPLSLGGAFGQTASGFGQAQIPFIKQRELQTQAAIANAQSSAAILGAGIGAIGAIFSDERLKSNAVRISTLHPFDIPIYEYEIGGVRQIGVFASDIEEQLPGHIGERYGYKTVQYEGLDGTV
jgi:hypothetical protein